MSEDDDMFNTKCFNSLPIPLHIHSWLLGNISDPKFLRGLTLGLMISDIKASLDFFERELQHYLIF